MTKSIVQIMYDIALLIVFPMDSKFQAPQAQLGCLSDPLRLYLRPRVPQIAFDVLVSLPEVNPVFTAQLIRVTALC